MRQPEGSGVEERAGSKTTGATVEPVSGDGVTDVGQMDPDLVSAAAQEETGDERRVARASGQRVDESDCRPPLSSHGETPPVAGIPGDGRADQAVFRPGITENDAEIEAADPSFPPCGGGRSESLGAAGEEEHTTGQAVQTVEETEEGTPPLTMGQLDEEPLVHGHVPGIMPLRRLGENARRLEGRQEPVVFLEKLDGWSRWQGKGDFVVGQEVDDVAGFDEPGEDSDRTAVSPDAARLRESPAGPP